MALIYSEKLKMGWKAVDFNLQGADGNTYNLNSFSNKKGLLVAFTCNHCPYARAAWPTLVGLFQKYQGDMNFIAINPNDEKEFPEDSFAEMQKKQQEWNIPFPYLQDKTQDTARNYSAQCTPDIYLFKKEEDDFKLFYHGRISDDWEKPALARERNLEQAIIDLSKDGLPPENQPPSIGCSIKWREGGF